MFAKLKMIYLLIKETTIVRDYKLDVKQRKYIVWKHKG